MLRQSGFNAHGLTTRCKGCQWLAHKVGNSKNHTEDGRRRIEEAIGKCGEEIARMQKQKDRIDSAVAQIVADGDQDVAGRDGNHEGNANYDAKEGEMKDNGDGDHHLQAPQGVAHTTLDI